MNEIQAVVRQQAGGLVLVETQPRSGCNRCQSKQGCASVSLSRLFCASPRLFSLSSDLNLTVGDVVVIGMHEQLVLKSALIVYGFPVVALISGAWLGRSIGAPGSDTLSIILGLSAFAVGVLAIKFWDWRLGRLKARPVIVRKISGPVLSVSSG